MKSKKEIKELAKKVYDLEIKYQEGDKNLQSLISEIEIIMESLSLAEGLELDQEVMDLLKNN